MIHNRSIKEVRRYDIFKLVVLLGLLLLLIFMVWQDEENISGVATGEESAYPASDESTGSVGDESAEPGDESAYPGTDESTESTGDETAYPGSDESAYPGTDEPTGSAGDESTTADGGEAYPAGGEEGDQSAPPDAPAYPGADEGSELPDAGEAEEQPASGDGSLQLSSPAPGAEVTAGSVTFSGTGAPGSQVLIVAGDSELGQAAVDEAGNWQVDVDVAPGDTNVGVQMVDANGNVTATAPPVVLVVTDAPTEEPQAESQAASISEDALFAGGSDLSGSGVPGTTIAVIVNNQEHVTAVVEDDGTWTAPVDLPEGDQIIVLQSISADGSVIDETEPLAVIVQEPILPAVDLPPSNVYAYGLTLTGTGQPNTDVQIIADEVAVTKTAVNKDGTWFVDVNLEAGSYNIDVATLDDTGNIVEQIPGLSLPVLPLPGPRLRPAQPDVTEFDPLLGLFLLKGVADPGSQVGIMADDELIGSATSADNGRWEFATELASGAHELSVGDLDESGNIAEPSEPIPIAIIQQPPTLALPEESMDNSDPEAPAVNVTVGAFAVSGQAEPNTEVAIIVDKEVNVTVIADESGNWTAEGDIEEGQHELQLAVLDENGAIAVVSEPLPLNVSPSPEPVLEPVELDTTNGDATVSGTTRPDTVVNLLINGAVLAATTSDEGGLFSFELRLGPGSYELQVETLDAEGNVEFTSAIEPVEVPAAQSADSEEAAPPDDAAADGEDTAVDATSEEADTASDDGDTAVDSTSEEADAAADGEDTAVDPTSEEADVINAADVQGNFGTLLDGLESAGLTQRLQDVEQPHTLTAPTDHAFASLPAEIVDAWNQNPESYAEILFYMVLEGRYTEDELLQSQVLTTIGGTNIGITTDGENTLVNGVPIQSSIPAGNSIVHAVDEIILPPLGYETQPPIINESGVAIFTGTYLTVVGTAEPGKQVLLQVSGENFGEIATVDEEGSWQASDDISNGVHDIVAYMLDDNGTLMAISQIVSLPVQ